VWVVVVVCKPNLVFCFGPNQAIRLGMGLGSSQTIHGHYCPCFVDFQLFRSSSSEVVFHGGRLPDFQNSENCFELYSYTSITNVINNVFDLKLF
jgi:hypothetical protein